MTLLIVIAVIILLYVFVLLRPQRREIDRFCLRPYAHRGQHDENLPENSLAAFRRAVENGYGIELDLQLSVDGEVMVMHDYNLRRMTGCDKMLKELTAAELQKLHLNGTEERVPTLKEVLDIVKGKVPLLIELKGESTDVSLCPKANEILKNYSGKYIIESFNPLMLNWYRKNRPDVVRGILITNICHEKKHTPSNFVLGAMMLNVLARPNFISYDLRHRGYFSIWLSTRLFGVARFGWTVSSEEGMKISKEENAYPIFESIIPK